MFADNSRGKCKISFGILLLCTFHETKYTLSIYLDLDLALTHFNCK